MTMVQIGIVRVTVRQWLMPVPVGMGFARRRIRAVLVLVVLVVIVAVLVPHRIVGVLVLVSLCQVQP